jgi:hypothetical protein
LRIRVGDEPVTVSQQHRRVRDVRHTSRASSGTFGRLLPLVVILAFTAVACPTGSVISCLAWTRVPTPSPGSSENQLEGVAATSASDAWAVGYYSSGTAPQTLILHWNGTAWTQVPSPNPGGPSLSHKLHNVAATSATDAWAVGEYGDISTGDRQALILHWNGTAWSYVPVAVPSAVPVYLHGVAATSASEAWAVGDFNPGGGHEALMLHWNGTTWAQVPGPYATYYPIAESVAATSPNDVWAVGSDEQIALMAHWDGTAWSHVPSPHPGGFGAYPHLYAVAATSSSDAWAVGEYNDANFVRAGFIQHWNGTEWTVVSSPSLNRGPLWGVAATSSSNAWAVGAGTQIGRWNGTAWNQTNPNLGGHLFGVAAISSGEAWAVGTHPYGTMALHCSVPAPRTSAPTTTSTPTTTPGA